MMKKIFALLMALMMVFSLAACGDDAPASSTPSSTPNSDPEPFTPPANLYELLSQDMEQMLMPEGERIDGSVDLEMFLTIEGDEGKEVVVEMQATTKWSGTSVEDVRFDLSALLRIPSYEDILISAYYQDGYLYLSTSGEKMRIPLSLSTQEDTSSPSADLSDLDADTIELLKGAVVQSGSAGHCYELVLNGQTVEAALAGIAQAAAGLAGDALDMDALLEMLDVDDMTFALTVNPDNHAVELWVEGDISLLITAGTEQTLTYGFETGVSLTFGAVSIEVPDNLDEYKRQMTEDDYTLIYGMLFNEDGTLIENNEIAYNLMCSEYGKDTVDEFIALILAAQE